MYLCASGRDHSQCVTQAFADAYEIGLPTLTRFLLKRGLNSDTARELAQAAWVKAWEHIPELRNLESLRWWTTAIAINLMHDAVKRRNRWQSLEKVSPAFQPSLLATIATEQILSMCTETERALLRRYYVDGQSMREIASEEGCSELATR